jgi:hypothetical protein
MTQQEGDLLQCGVSIDRPAENTIFVNVAMQRTENPLN